MRIIVSVIRLLLASLLLTACTLLPSQASLRGLPKGEVRKSLGAPVHMDYSDGGQRWQYDAGPNATQAFFVFFDDDGIVRSTEALRNEKKFNQIGAGMTESDVVDEIGHPPQRHSIARDRGYVWSYRHATPTCLWFQVEFAPEGVVRSTGYNRRPNGIPCR